MLFLSNLKKDGYFFTLIVQPIATVFSSGTFLPAKSASTAFSTYFTETSLASS